MDSPKLHDFLRLTNPGFSNHPYIGKSLWLWPICFTPTPHTDQTAVDLQMRQQRKQRFSSFRCYNPLYEKASNRKHFGPLAAVAAVLMPFYKSWWIKDFNTQVGYHRPYFIKMFKPTLKLLQALQSASALCGGCFVHRKFTKKISDEFLPSTIHFLADFVL